MKKAYQHLLILGVVVSVFFLLSSCITSQKDSSTRTPSSGDPFTAEVKAYINSDEFANDGYDHNHEQKYTIRNFEPGQSLSASQEIRELAGREIWFKSAPNERLHTYYFPQKLNSPITWYDVLRADKKSDRFQRWGMINDPDCCVPGKDCDTRNLKYHNHSVTMSDTFGWDYCKGDEALLDSLQDSSKWKDPACDNPIIKAADSLDSKPREKACELSFGNPSGAVGYRKFPNPRFNAVAWNKAGGYPGYEGKITKAEIDASIEPPFRVAIACASCHAAFDPLNPPQNTAAPGWRNIKGETGNQYLNVSAILGSGTKKHDIESQMFLHARAGSTDTSAVPNDGVNNPGTINALINIPMRPHGFKDIVTRWNNVDSCSGSNCQSIPYADGRTKYWEKSTKEMPVFHILKGGEDSVGADLAVQRVYLNIGMCAEACWVNHLTNIRELDPAQRGFGQTPFNIPQCRRDCASWRANEDRVGNILDYILSRRPTDLKEALHKKDEELGQFLDQRYGGNNLVEGGRQIFVKNCASCHSSQNTNKQDLTPNDPLALTTQFTQPTASLDNGEILRADWMGNEKSTDARAVGTYYCRSQHSNHMQGHVWEQFASRTYRDKPSSGTNALGEKTDGGRGYYRNISLLNVWAHAPFMHNNAIGPEICGRPSDIASSKWRTSVDQKQGSADKMMCEQGFDPSAMGRLKLFEASVDELLTPEGARRKKISKTDESIIIPIAAEVALLKSPVPLTLEIPAGFPTNAFGSFHLKAFLRDMQGAFPLFVNYDLAGASQKQAQLAAYQAYWKSRIPDATAAKDLSDTSLQTFATFKAMTSAANLESFKASIRKNEDTRLLTYMKYYSNCDANFENMGHNFGTDLTSDQKKALKAFLATL